MAQIASGASRGFSLIELLVSTAVILVIIASILTAVTRFQVVFRGEQQMSVVRESIRGAEEVMSEEIGQAGSLSFSNTTLSSPITGNTATAQTIPLNPNSSTPFIFKGEKLLIDAGTAGELVKVTAINPVKGVITTNHATSAPVTAVGLFPAGILTTANGNTLQLFGDINADGTLQPDGTIKPKGTLQYVEYTCDTTAGLLTRSITPITDAKSPARPLVSNLIANNPGGATHPLCFTVQTATCGATTCVTGVTVTLTAQTATADLMTGTFRWMTSTFTVTPRTVVAAFALAQQSSTAHIQPTPPGLPM
jgi:prepilin-type N-terminal cleavage/methylation domain-containing protein